MKLHLFLLLVLCLVNALAQEETPQLVAIGYADLKAKGKGFQIIDSRLSPTSRTLRPKGTLPTACSGGIVELTQLNPRNDHASAKFFVPGECLRATVNSPQQYADGVLEISGNLPKEVRYLAFLPGEEIIDLGGRMTLEELDCEIEKAPAVSMAPVLDLRHIQPEVLDASETEFTRVSFKPSNEYCKTGLCPSDELDLTRIGPNVETIRTGLQIIAETATNTRFRHPGFDENVERIYALKNITREKGDLWSADLYHPESFGRKELSMYTFYTPPLVFAREPESGTALTIRYGYCAEFHRENPSERTCSNEQIFQFGSTTPLGSNNAIDTSFLADTDKNVGFIWYRVKFGGSIR